MGAIKSPEFVNLVCVVFGNDINYKIKDVIDALESRFGKIDFISKPLGFSEFTSYYEKEMGSPLQSRILSFEVLIHPSELADIKLITNQIEMDFSIDGKRVFNIDAGYIHHSQFVLATTKSWGSRIYLKNGIYAEVTLLFLNGHFRSWEMTYPNYRTQAYIEELEKIRNLYMEKKRDLKRS